jgi:hypothetical protein
MGSVARNDTRMRARFDFGPFTGECLKKELTFLWRATCAARWVVAHCTLERATT